MSILQKIKEIEDEMARTQRNKATSYHLGLLKAKLAKFRRELITPSKGGGAATGEGFDVTKSGDARVGLIGFPSVGKSTLLTKLTGTFSEVAAYEFTTLTCVPGVIVYKGARVQSSDSEALSQLLDLPGIIEGAKDGKGRGRQVIAVGRTCNLILIVLDALKPLQHKRIIEKEVEGFGIRLNKKPPNMSFKRKERGGIALTHVGNFTPTHLDQDTVKAVLSEYKIHNADIILRENSTVDELIDVIEGNRIYVPCLYVLNKIDQLTLEELQLLDKIPHYVPISAGLEWNLDELLDKIWEYLDLQRIYTKPKGQIPDYEAPVVMRRDCTVEDFCNKIHRTILRQFKYAAVWGASVKFNPQKCGKDHVLQDEDVVQIIKKLNSHPSSKVSEMIPRYCERPHATLAEPRHKRFRGNHSIPSFSPLFVDRAQISVPLTVDLLSTVAYIVVGHLVEISKFGPEAEKKGETWRPYVTGNREAGRAAGRNCHRVKRADMMRRDKCRGEPQHFIADDCLVHVFQSLFYWMTCPRAPRLRWLGKERRRELADLANARLVCKRWKELIDTRTDIAKRSHLVLGLAIERHSLSGMRYLLSHPSCGPLEQRTLERCVSADFVTGLRCLIKEGSLSPSLDAMSRCSYKAFRMVLDETTPGTQGGGGWYDFLRSDKIRPRHILAAFTSERHSDILEDELLINHFGMIIGTNCYFLKWNLWEMASIAGFLYIVLFIVGVKVMSLPFTLTLKMVWSVVSVVTFIWVACTYLFLFMPVSFTYKRLHKKEESKL
ncbi:hypothetical protein PROFUN_04351 [Planoprotostelium fungivorum]|uniref:Uncharacterized protein n=1 Tax=Planoprotostelium fungivorum TaxID=1890364 RepID=A0A2P6NHR1_9EUKA|nr:hypothetical protein PROFUN_04351 [Planoprotostelium fungivorum]